MKRLIVILAMVLVAAGASAQTKEGDSSFGASLGYAFDTNNVTLGVDYRYNFTDEIRFAPSFTFFTKYDGLKSFNFDLDAHFVFQLYDKMSFYPIGGVGISFWDYDYSYSKILLGVKYDSHETRLGAHLGMGLEYYATKDLTFGLEGKYHMIDDFSQPMIALRVGYRFDF